MPKQNKVHKEVSKYNKNLLIRNLSTIPFIFWGPVHKI